MLASDLHLEGLQVLQQKGRGAPDRGVETSLESQDAMKAERVIRCASCAAEITRESAAISVAGDHTHVCVNPDGMAFDIACYRDAPGCITHGVPETFWSWFTGYAWCLAFCRACGTQLGWNYVGESSRFFGLILARIRQT